MSRTTRELVPLSEEGRTPLLWTSIICCWPLGEKWRNHLAAEENQNG